MKHIFLLMEKIADRFTSHHSLTRMQVRERIRALPAVGRDGGNR